MDQKQGRTYIKHDARDTHSSLPVGTHLLSFASKWHEITSNAWVLETVTKEYSLEFLWIP